MQQVRLASSYVSLAVEGGGETSNVVHFSFPVVFQLDFSRGWGDCLYFRLLCYTPSSLLPETSHRSHEQDFLLRPQVTYGRTFSTYCPTTCWKTKNKADVSSYQAAMDLERGVGQRAGLQTMLHPFQETTKTLTLEQDGTTLVNDSTTLGYGYLAFYLTLQARLSYPQVVPLWCRGQHYHGNYGRAGRSRENPPEAATSQNLPHPPPCELTYNTTPLFCSPQCLCSYQQDTRLLLPSACELTHKKKGLWHTLSVYSYTYRTQDLWCTVFVCWFATHLENVTRYMYIM